MSKPPYPEKGVKGAAVVRMIKGRYAGSIRVLPYHIAKPLIESGYAELLKWTPSVRELGSSVEPYFAWGYMKIGYKEPVEPSRGEYRFWDTRIDFKLSDKAIVYKITMYVDDKKYTEKEGSTTWFAMPRVRDIWMKFQKAVRDKTLEEVVDELVREIWYTIEEDAGIHIIGDLYEYEVTVAGYGTLRWRA